MLTQFDVPLAREVLLDELDAFVQLAGELEETLQDRPVTGVQAKDLTRVLTALIEVDESVRELESKFGRRRSRVSAAGEACQLERR